MTEFARAMLEADEAFASRVRSFGERFGQVAEDTLGVLAQAAYLCWGNLEYDRNLDDVVRAIGKGRPTRLFYHRQVTPERWAEVNSYIVGAQEWLGLRAPVPDSVDEWTVGLTPEWLGEASPGKKALTRLFVANASAQVGDLTLGALSGEAELGSPEYADFSEWWMRKKGEEWDALIDDALQNAAAEAPEARARELVEGITQLSPPPCVHRFTRYLEIQLTSIGVLRWRGALPPNRAPVNEWEARLRETRKLLGSWMDGGPVGGATGLMFRALLGERTDAKAAIVEEFLLAEDRGDEIAWHWLDEYVRRHQLSASARFDQA